MKKTPKKLPTNKEIAAALKQVKGKIDSWQYPAFMVDFSWRSIYVNAAFPKHLNLPVFCRFFMNKMPINLVETPFLPKIINRSNIELGEDETSLKPSKVAFIEAFKSEQRNAVNEDWYKKLIKRLQKNEEFAKIWDETSPGDSGKTLHRYHYKKVTFKKSGRKIQLLFHIYASPLSSNPALWLAFYEPADKATAKFFN